MNKIRFLSVLLTLLLSTSAAATDMTITYMTKERKKTGEKIQYLSDKFSFTTEKAKKMDTLQDNDQGMIYIIDHSKKVIEFIRMNDLKNMMGQTSQMMSQMMGAKMPGSKGTIGENMQKTMDKKLGKADQAPLERLGTETIAGRSCDSYRVLRKGKGMEMIEEVCIDPTMVPPGQSNPVGEEMEAMGQEMVEGPLSGFMSSGQKELRGIKGLILRRRIKMGTRGMASVMSFGMGKSDSLEEVTAIKEGPIDPSVFKLPTGYKEVDKAKEMQEEMKKGMEQMGGAGIPGFE